MIFLVVVLSACISSREYVEIGGKRIAAEIADNPDEWEKGLMFKESLPPDSGMLFVFPDEALRSFWMKNTLIPLDMIFADSNGTIVNITKSAQPCKAILCESYSSGKPAKYVLEVNGGFSDANMIGIGDRMAYGRK